jgi:uncharacterized membrane-anchored protein YjiN (DUF445 family)
MCRREDLPVSGAAATGAPERALARQKAWATGLVVLCAIVFVGAKALEGRHSGAAYVAAFAEAAIIGALADWYAVVALFRHPFGLKLPHTAIIPANQARIAENLGDFIARHFLAGAQVGTKTLELDPAANAGRWLDEPATVRSSPRTRRASSPRRSRRSIGRRCTASSSAACSSGSPQSTWGR